MAQEVCTCQEICKTELVALKASGICLTQAS